MPQFTAEEAGVEEMEDEDVDINCTTPILNDDFWESQHPNSPLFTPLQAVPQSPATTEVQVGSDEPRATPSVHEDIPATSAEETVNEEQMPQAATAEELKFLSMRNLRSRFLRWFCRSLTPLNPSQRIPSP